MATALDIASRTLKLLLVEAADSPLEPDEYQDYYAALNDFMAALEANDVRLGFTPVTGPADEVTVPDGALRGIVYNMAIEVASDYGATASPEIIKIASNSMDTLYRLGMQPIQSSYPPTLPRGTGNADYPDIATLYNAQAAGVAWFTGNTKVTAINAADTPVRVRGQWHTNGFEALSFTSPGRLTNANADSVMLDVDAFVTATAASAVDANFILMRNGAEQVATSAVSLSTTRADGTVSANVTLEPGEYIEIWVENTTDATDITVADARLEVV